MSQRSAPIAAAIATALVSEPPRPRVLRRPVSGWMPWKPAITATSPRLKPASRRAPSIFWIRAEPVLVGGLDRDLPALPGAGLETHLGEYDGQEARRDLLARGDDRVVFGLGVERRGVLAPGHQLVGLAGHRRDDDRDLVAGPHLAGDVAGDVADAGRPWRRRCRRISSPGGAWGSDRTNLSCAAAQCRGRPAGTSGPGRCQCRGRIAGPAHDVLPTTSCA